MIRLALRVPVAQAEVVRAQLIELAPNGWEEDELSGELVEFALYGAPGELPALPALRAAAGDALCDVRTEEVPDDWADGWKRFHGPVVVGDRLQVRPPWAPAARGGVEDIVIDPGQAFGTGSHGSTRLCLELMLGLRAQGSFADLGCGSGVLAIAATRLGWSPVLALDHEAAAVEAARENAAVNSVDLEVHRWDLRTDTVPEAGTIAANLLAPLLVVLAARMERPPAHLIASGLLPAQVDDVVAAFARHGLREQARPHAGDWSAVLLGA